MELKRPQYLLEGFDWRIDERPSKKDVIDGFRYVSEEPEEDAEDEKSETVEKFLKSRGKQMGTDLTVKNWALFMIE